MNYKFPTTLEEYINEHRKMWTWIGDETLKRKEKVEKYEYLESIDVRVISDCWLCNYVYKNYKIKGRCFHCPLQWVDTDGKEVYNCCDNPKNLYYEWCDEEDYRKSAELAYKIANLKEKEEELL